MNQVIAADAARRIHLHGVGEVARPVDIDSSVTGFRHLKSLRIYHFLPGQVINGEAEGDEVCIVLMKGDITMEVQGRSTHTWHLQGRTNVFTAAPHVVYLPPHHSYRLTPQSEAEVAYARAEAEGQFPARLFPAEEASIDTRVGGQVRTLLGVGEAEHLLCTEVVTSGGWRPYPPHKHDSSAEDEFPLEQLSHYRFDPPGAFALARAYHEAEDKTFTILDYDTLALDRGYHTVVTPPESSSYSLTLLAGPGPADFKARTYRLR